MKTRIRVLLMALVLAVSISVISPTALAYALLPTHWPKDTTYSYQIGSDISQDGVYSITLADNQWNGMYNRKVYLSDSGTRTSSTSASRNYKNEVIKRAAGLTGWVGQCSYWYSQGITSEADVTLNTSYALTNSTPPEATNYHVCSIVTHEFGHMIGLDDCYTSGAVMYYSLPPGVARYTLATDDINGYNAIHW